MDWLFGAYSAARVTTDAISVGTNDYTHRASEVFKSANPPKVADLNQLIQEYSMAKGTEGTALMGIGNHLFAKKSPAERNNMVILLASLIKNIIDANTYTNIIILDKGSEKRRNYFVFVGESAFFFFSNFFSLSPVCYYIYNMCSASKIYL